MTHNRIYLHWLFVICCLLAASATRAYDLFGSDIAATLVQTPDGCNAACNGNPSCVSWTFVRAGLKHPTSPVCFMKNTIPAPSLNAVCTSNADCLSGAKRFDGWCGETPTRNVGSSGIQGQGQVLSCAAGTSCNQRRTTSCEGWWIFRTCTTLLSTDMFCM